MNGCLSLGTCLCLAMYSAWKIALSFRNSTITPPPTTTCYLPRLSAASSPRHNKENHPAYPEHFAINSMAFRSIQNRLDFVGAEKLSLPQAITVLSLHRKLLLMEKVSSKRSGHETTSFAQTALRPPFLFQRLPFSSPFSSLAPKWAPLVL
jgi:hypothetical protein